MVLTTEDVKQRYPLHWMVWNDEHEDLKARFEANTVTTEELELRDPRDRTPLLLAVTLGRTNCVRRLIEAGADVNCEKDGWSVVQEATSAGDPDILSLVVSRRDYLRHAVRAGGIPDLLRRLSLAPDFYVEMKWEFTSWVPLVSRMCPFDTYKVYKRGGNVRVDTTLVGFENNHWQRGDRTYIFRGQGQNASLTELDHELGTMWSETLEPDAGREWPPPQPAALQARLAQPTALNYLDTDKISFERNKSGIWGWRQDKTEVVNTYECKVFSANNVELVSKTRTEHLSKAEKSRLEPRAPLAGLVALADRDRGATMPTAPSSPDVLREDDIASKMSTSRSREELAVTWQEYFSEEPLERDIGKPKEITTKVQKLRATLWLCEDYPLELQEQIMPILDLMASMSSPHFAKLKDFIQLQLPAGFPVKIEIPLFHVMNARITFGNIFGTETAVPNVECIQEGSRLACVVDDACFSVAKGYRDVLSPDERIACSMEHDESLLQYIIQQSLMDPGTHDDQVDMWETLRGSRSSPSPRPRSPRAEPELLAHEKRQLQKCPVRWTDAHQSRRYVAGILLPLRRPGVTDPDDSDGDRPIHRFKGLAQVQANPDVVVFQSGVTRGANGSLVTAGGRVLLVCARAGPLRAAAAAAAGDFPGKQSRKDIAHKAFSIINGLSCLQAGVDIDAAALLVRKIEPLATGTHRRGVLGRLGCFSGLFQLAAMDPSLQDPVLVQGTDGVGTKLKVAETLNKYDTIGQDLVAMCVNDILCAGAEPFAFLDYMACGRLQVDVATTIVRGIADACIQSGCALLGGKTAEMPSMYDIGKYDLAGFAVGVVDNHKQLPRSREIRAGDVVLALASTGVHSNGYSLVQKIMLESGHSYFEKAPFSTSKKTFGEEFLEPTGLYVNALLPAVKRGSIKALAHITGGGLLENIPRILPAGVKVVLDATKFQIKPIFGWLQAKGGVSDFEMLRTFNCGVGMVMIVDPICLNEVLESVEGIVVVGSVQAMGKEGGHQVVVENFKHAMAPLTAPYGGAGAETNKSLSYKDSGVDIEAGDSLVSLIKPLARSTSRSGVLGGLGGFGGCFQLKAIEQEYKDPVLVLASDGVGTKLKIAQKINQHGTIGIDLVAMCVNDILCNGASPLTFLDYFACGRLDVTVARAVVSGVAEGCRQAQAALIGGETAEMPGMYDPGVYDIAGFALGVVERSHVLPKIQDITVGDTIIGLPSNGIHSNGFNLIHKLVKKAGLTLNDKAPFSKDGLTLGEELINPTRIYVRSVLPALQRGLVKAVAHITGGGLLDNIPRVTPEWVRARLNAHWWNVHPVFAWIADAGSVSDEVMLRTFNCGIGMVLIVSPENHADVMNITRSFGAMVIGSIQARPPGGARVLVENFASALDFTRRMPSLPSKRVAVLVSGNGSNLQALLDTTRDPSQCMCADIVLVISNKEDAFALKRAEKAVVPSLVFNYKDYTSQEEFDRAITAALEANKIDIVCLAGYMRILSSEFVQKWKGKLLNIHPSLLPLHPGLHAAKQCLDAGDRESGCTIHFVDEGMDTGPIILQERVPVLKDDTAESLTERIHGAEHRAFPRALRLVATGRVRLSAQGNLIWYS